MTDPSSDPDQGREPLEAAAPSAPAAAAVEPPPGAPAGDAPTVPAVVPSAAGPIPTPSAPGPTAAPGPAVDLGRRRFFRAFAGELIQTAATVAGAAQALQQASAEAASVILNPEGSARLLGPAGDDATGTPGAASVPGSPTGFRTPFREDRGVLYLIDQRRLPDALVEYPVKSAGEVAFAIREMIVRGAPAIGQVAAIGLAMSAEQQADGRPYARKATLRGGANALINSRPTAVNLRWAVERVLARYTEVGELSDDGFAIAAAMRSEADAIVFEATTDHGRLAGFGLEILPQPEGRPVRILTHCNTGPLACGQYGTALGIVQAAHHAGRDVHVWVDETRPHLQGARLTTWELAQAGVSHALLPDVAAGHLMALGEVDVVLVGADRVAANGDTANKVGTYPLAVLAARHGIPFYVCAPSSSVDLATADGSSIEIEERKPEEVLEFRGVRIAPAGTEVRNPAFDVTPAELITGIVTEEGVVRAPFETGLPAAVELALARWAAMPGYRAIRPAEEPATSAEAPATTTEPAAEPSSSAAPTAPLETTSGAPD